MLNVFFAIQRAIRFRKNETGASAVEYGLLVALIAAVIVAAVLIFGDFLAGIFTDTCSAIDNGAGGTGTGMECDAA